MLSTVLVLMLSMLHLMSPRSSHELIALLATYLAGSLQVDGLP